MFHFLAAPQTLGSETAFCSIPSVWEGIGDAMVSNQVCRSFSSLIHTLTMESWKHNNNLFNVLPLVTEQFFFVCFLYILFSSPEIQSDMVKLASASISCVLFSVIWAHADESLKPDLKLMLLVHLFNCKWIVMIVLKDKIQFSCHSREITVSNITSNTED